MVQHTLQLLHVSCRKQDTHAFTGLLELGLPQLTETTTVKTAENTGNGNPIMLLQPGGHALNDLRHSLGFVASIALVERHRLPNVLKCSMLYILTHNCGLLSLQNLVVSLQLSIAILELGVRHATSLDISSNLVFFLVSRQLVV